jgi:hypothetical protein
MTSLRATGKQVKALLPADIGEDLERLQKHLGLSTAANVISLAIRKLAIAEFQGKKQATPLDEREAV